MTLQEHSPTRRCDGGDGWLRSGKRTRHSQIPMFRASGVRLFGVIFLQCLTDVFPASKLSEVRLRMTHEEVAEAERGQHTPHKISMSVFIRMGLELEDQQ